MPIFNADDNATDKNGLPIKEGDILRGGSFFSEPCFFVCVAGHKRNTYEVRDLNAWNVAMCDLGLAGDVENIGHYSVNPGILDDEILEQHFSKPAVEQWKEREAALKWAAENPGAIRRAVTELFRDLIWSIPDNNPIRAALERHGAVKKLDGGATIRRRHDGG